MDRFGLMYFIISHQTNNNHLIDWGINWKKLYSCIYVGLQVIKHMPRLFFVLLIYIPCPADNLDFVPFFGKTIFVHTVWRCNERGTYVVSNYQLYILTSVRYSYCNFWREVFVFIV